MQLQSQSRTRISIGLVSRPKLLQMIGKGIITHLSYMERTFPASNCRMSSTSTSSSSTQQNEFLAHNKQTRRSGTTSLHTSALYPNNASRLAGKERTLTQTKRVLLRRSTRVKIRKSRLLQDVALVQQGRKVVFTRGPQDCRMIMSTSKSKEDDEKVAEE